jgi:hypothetical protein
MTNREIDCVIMGLAAGGITCLWLGYHLRVRVERWQTGRAARAGQRARRDAKRIPFQSPGTSTGTIPGEETTRYRGLRGGRVIPLTSKRHAPSVDDADKVDPIPLPVTPLRAVPDGNPDGLAISPGWVSPEVDRARATETARMIRADALAALTGAGYKRAAAEAALDACSMVERAGGLESWVAAALRRAAAKS